MPARWAGSATKMPVHRRQTFLLAIAGASPAVPASGRVLLQGRDPLARPRFQPARPPGCSVLVGHGGGRPDGLLHVPPCFLTFIGKRRDEPRSRARPRVAGGHDGPAGGSWPSARSWRATWACRTRWAGSPASRTSSTTGSPRCSGRTARSPAARRTALRMASRRHEPASWPSSVGGGAWSASCWRPHVLPRHDRPTPAATPAGGRHRTAWSLNKYWVDEIYDRALRSRPAAAVARGRLVRSEVIDGLVNLRPSSCEWHVSMGSSIDLIVDGAVNAVGHAT